MSEITTDTPTAIGLEETRAACRICTELHKFLHSAHEADAPHLSQGLTEAGIRNRDHQRRERILKAEADLARHQKSCLIAQAQTPTAS